jgi:transposase
MGTAELELVEEEFDDEEIEEIEGDIEVLPEPLSATKAKALNKKIHTAMDKMTTQRDAFLDLLDEAAAGQIHVSLGYASWPAYLAAEVQFTPADLTERHDLAVALSGKGASQRAIATILGVSQSTARRELEGEEFEDDTVTSLTGSTVPRHKPPVVEEDDEPEEAKPTTAAELVAEFDVEAANAHNAVAAMVEIMTEQKWPGARKRVGKAHLNHIGEWQESLQAIVDDLMAV